MRLTTKGRFAVTAMLDLALRGGKNPVTLAGISERQDISLSYLEQLFSRLRRHELVESVRGPGGGYYLARALDDVSVADIIRAVDEPIDATQCGGKENCHDEHRCLTHDLWTGLNAHIYDYLDNVTLATLVAKQDECKDKVLQDRRTSKMTLVACMILSGQNDEDTVFRLLRHHPGRSSRGRKNDSLSDRAFRQSGIALPSVWLGSREGGGRRAWPHRRAGGCRPQGNRFHIWRYRIEQPRDQGGRPLLFGHQGQAHHYRAYRAQGRARYRT